MAAKKVTGIYVSSKTVDLVQLEESAGRVRVASFARKDFSADVAKTTAVEALNEAIISSLKKAVAETKASIDEVHTSISAKDIIVRFFKMPYLALKERDQAVKFEARKYIPFKMDEVLSGYTTVEESKKSGQMSVLFAAAKRDIASRYLILLTRSGIRPKVMDTVPTALARLFSYNGQLDDKAATAVLYISEDGTANIYIIKNEVPYLTRDVELGVEKEKTSQKLAAELQTSLDYFRRQFPDIDVKKIIIAGEGDFTDLQAYLASQFGIAVQTADLTKNIPALIEMPKGMCVALGLALGGFEKVKAEKLNLIPATLIPQKIDVAGPAIKIGILSLAAVVAIGVTLGVKNLGLQNELKSLESAQPALSPSIKEMSVEDLGIYNKEMTDKTNFLKTQTADRFIFTQKLSQIPILLPEDAWLTSLVIEDIVVGAYEGSYPQKVQTQAEIKGIVYSGARAQELKSVNEFVQKLKSNANFFKGFAEAQIKSTKVSVVREREATTFDIMVTSK